MTKSMIALALLAGLAALSVWSVMPPKPRGNDAPATDFSAARAFGHVQQVGKATHVAGSAANDQVRQYLLTTLEGMGLNPEVQETIGWSDRDGRTPAAARVKNVVVEIPGEQSTGRVFLMAHYDSVQTGPGANDDGAGVSTILETVRALKQGPKQRNDIVLVFTDAEEACLCGAEAFVAEHRFARSGGIVLNVEARGSSGPAIMFETSAGNADVVGVFGAHAPHPVGTSVAVEVYRILPNDTDFSPFRISNRFGGLNSAYIDGSGAYHRPQDTPDRMDTGSLQHHGDNLLALTRAFGAADLATIAMSSGPDASYFPAFGVLVTYPGQWVWPLAILALLAVIVYGWLAVRKGQTTLGRVAAGIGFSLIPIILVPVAAQLFWTLLTILKPAYANMIDPWRPAWFRWAVVALVAAIVLGWYAWTRRKADVVIGGLTWLAVLGVLMALAIPGGSYLTAIPALAGALAGIAALYVNDAVKAIGAAVAVVILAPTVALFFPALGLATAAAPALFAVLLGLALLPVLEKIPWAATTAVVLAIALTGVGLAVDRFDERHPIPSQLMYALDADKGTAIWASDESEPGEWTKQYVSKQETEQFRILHDVWTGPAQATSLPAPQVNVLGEQADGDKRTVRLIVVPQRQVRLVYVHMSGVESVTIGGRTMRSREGEFELLFHAPAKEGLPMTLVAKAVQKLKVQAMDGSDGLTGLPGFKPRPSNVDAAGSHTSELVLVSKSYEI